MRCESSNASGSKLSNQLIFFHILCFVTGLLSSVGSHWIPISLVLVTCYIAISIRRNYPLTGGFGLSLRRHDNEYDLQDTAAAAVPPTPGSFQVPFMPFLPLFGISMNWYLIAQLEFTGMLLLILYLGIISSLYLTCRKTQQSWSHYDRILDADGPVLLREMSLPKRYTDRPSDES